LRPCAQKESQAATAAGIALGLVFWVALPFAFLPSAYLVGAYRDWLSALSRHSAVSFTSFDNLFAFAANNFGIVPDYGTAQLVALGFAALLGARVLWAARNPAPAAAVDLWALALGCGYTTLFSPLQQTNAYIIFVPVFIAALPRARADRRWAWLLAFVWLAMTFGYSDLVPAATRGIVRHAVIRSAAAALLVTALAFASPAPEVRA
jgi:hypothetical protein